MPFGDKIDNIKNDILGKKYSLSIAFVSKKKSREINKKYRKKDKPTNVLSFALRKNEGELVLCKTVIESEARLRLSASDRQAKKINKTYKEWLTILIIHGMLHLKGYDHGEQMEKLEEKYLSRTKF